MKYPQFAAAVRRLEPTPEARAARLGVKLRMLFYYEAGSHLPPLLTVVREPTLYAALRRDMTKLPSPEHLTMQ